MVKVAVGGDGASRVRTIILVGKTGNGKSATGNSILGYKAFESRLSSSGVTATCELRSGVSIYGQPVNVIDTPGLFDFTEGGSEVIRYEITECIDLAGIAGVDAVVFVLSLRVRFSQEEEAAFRSLKAFCGPRIVDYMIVVFTGGDMLEDTDIDEYLSQPDIPKPLKAGSWDYQEFTHTLHTMKPLLDEIIRLCENRVVVFDNRTKNELERLNQCDKLWCMLDVVAARNGGEPYMEKLAAGPLVAAASESRGAETEDEHGQRLKLIADMVEAKLNETKAETEKKLLEERLKRAEAERLAAESRRIAEAEAHKVREALEAGAKTRKALLKAEEEARRLRGRVGGDVRQPSENHITEIFNQLHHKCVIL